MSQNMDFSKQPGSATQATAPPFFSASMTRDAPVGALISVIAGFVLLLVMDMNLNAYLVSGLSAISEDVGLYAGGILSVPNLGLFNVEFPRLISYVYAVFLSFPACMAWLIGGIIVAVMRIKKGRDEGNLRPGWDVFWYGLVIIEIPFAIFGVAFLILSLNPASYVEQGFAGSVLLYFLLIFLQPTFWIGMLSALVGSLIGSVIAKRSI